MSLKKRSSWLRQEAYAGSECASVDFGRPSSLDACGSVVAKDEMGSNCAGKLVSMCLCKRRGTADGCAV